MDARLSGHGVRVGAAAAPPPEIWAGVECSVVRVHDRIVDELARTGHARRPGDLARLADLGIRTVRYPALWERHPDAAAGRFDWTWTDRRMETMRRLGLRPVLGLLHQGAGRSGELLEPGFAEAFADYAGTVAQRYPWVDAYVPINEPMTTARFAGLYGHWYPHARSDSVFTSLVVAEAQAFRAAVAAIRSVRPDATIIATEDVGVTFSTRRLADQARFDTARRWLILDILTGRFDRAHPLRWWLEIHGATAGTLDALCDTPAVLRPSVIGVHHYPTSDRFLDDRLERYPATSHGGNGRIAYADLEAVRVLGTERDGVREALVATADRYSLPVALTEVHLGGEARQRAAWWWDAVQTADDLSAAGRRIAAVTAWSAFGSWEWRSLLTLEEGHYEPGLFDTRRRPPRTMALALEVAAAAAGLRRRARVRGWWRRADRLAYPPVGEDGRDLLATAA